jgi:TPR repeat protein
LLLSQPGSSENDLTKARNWLERAAAAGDPQAALRLAEILLDGPDAEAHRDEAAKLLGVARTDADTDGIAVALLRSLGMPIVQ